MMRTFTAICLGLFLAATVQAQKPATETPKPGAKAATKPVAAGDVGTAGQKGTTERGQKLFADNKCSACHAIGGKGNPKGPLDAVGSKLSAEDIRQWLINPTEMTGKTKATRKPPMPSYAKLSKDDIGALVAYLQSLKKS